VNRIVAFGRFWYDFVVGDDWRIAAGLVVTLAVTALLAHRHISVWWLPPAAITLLLGLSLRRARRG
jgi:hypothetical protein